MIEPRIYRAAFVPALLAIVLVMFSLESRPRPLPQGLAGDVVFGGAEAVATTRSIVDAAPDRKAGTVGDREAARLVVEAFRARSFSVEVDRFQSDGEDLVNVIGRRAGRTRRQVVVVAARDASGVPDAGGSAADTAALMELARVFEGRPSQRSIVLASVDGSSLGEVGARRLADRLGDPDLVDGTLVVSGLGAPTGDPPSIVGWSNDTRRAGIGFQRTVAAALREEVARVAKEPGTAGQLARLAFPVGIGAQGPFLDRGYDAVRIAGGGELADTASSTVDQVDPDRIGGLGRAAFRTVDALDRHGLPEHGPRTYVTAVSQVMPGWVLALLGLTLILPALVVTVDALARARRRGIAIIPWLTWLAAGVAPFVIGLALAYALALTGAAPDPPAAPVDPDRFPLDVAAVAVLVTVLGTIALTWGALRFLLARAHPEVADPSTPGAAVVVCLVLSVATLCLWAGRPVRGAAARANTAPVDPGHARRPVAPAASPDRDGRGGPAPPGLAGAVPARRARARPDRRGVVLLPARHWRPREPGQGAGGLRAGRSARRHDRHRAARPGAGRARPGRRATVRKRPRQLRRTRLTGRNGLGPAALGVGCQPHAFRRGGRR